MVLYSEKERKINFMDKWKYYHHAILPTTAPHEEVDAADVYDTSIWKTQIGKKALFARWTSGYDCGHETNWWFCIKDTPLQIDELKAKRRYELRKGRKNFDVRRIRPTKYKNELYNIQKEAISTYPRKNRQEIQKEIFMRGINTWESYITFGAFFKGGGGRKKMRKSYVAMH